VTFPRGNEVNIGIQAGSLVHRAILVLRLIPVAGGSSVEIYFLHSVKSFTLMPRRSHAGRNV
jgi:hypothetical protein